MHELAPSVHCSTAASTLQPVSTTLHMQRAAVVCLEFVGIHASDVALIYRGSCPCHIHFLLSSLKLLC